MADRLIASWFIDATAVFDSQKTLMDRSQRTDRPLNSNLHITNDFAWF
ncbi:hypothetical protein H8F24_18305 [Synechococcus sp. CBW1002]|jgi:hypothetical protein|nr:hypothetical protein [Synechococcus sp. CBW1002]QPN59858.1 hypothetical protein H8F24_18305 [Synechococcus sp. CBW1002]CAK6692962.1 hypothetical protein IFHNHDMJ_01325 [Synechococcus sp. CBW1107]